MKRKIIQTKYFIKSVNSLFKKRQLLKDDFEEFKRKLADRPESGVLIAGTGGVRKVRLKSASGGKSGGFRVCYYFLTEDDELFLLLIYPKNIQENLTAQQKKELKEIVYAIRGTK